MDLKIFENRVRSEGKRYTVPVITLGLRMAYLNKPLNDKLEINNESRCVFSKDIESGGFFFCVLPLISNLRGFKPAKAGGAGGLSISLVGVRTKYKLPIGHFKLGEPIFKDPIDWYKLEKIGSNETI